MNDLFYAIENLKHDNQHFDFIEMSLKKYIEKTSKKYNLYYDYYNDILYHLWKELIEINLKNFNSELDLRKYISTSIKRYCINICKKKNRDKKIIYNSDATYKKLEAVNVYSLYCEDFEFLDLISILNYKEKQIIYMKFFECRKDNEIARRLHLSRQFIYKIRIKSLKKLYPIVMQLVNI
ncbi:botulinum neurotoxin transcription-activating sigma factor BotR [Clostridium botulinum D/C]|uniref:botulinum neurotoxin transcription-activating sigma factor BotR n=1 Tax=Clostridium botulinum TaxID=1491 RepID=UPI001E4F4546|nr:botulinum neurotoxin transcription-activating sigma factor BotR [Clostridium botulinum]MCD3327354.1 botulinum neurotoxin transcription-activating sigma factor BotR [Clostridium botulinum D/C]